LYCDSFLLPGQFNFKVFDAFIECALVVGDAHVQVVKLVDLDLEVDSQSDFIFILGDGLLHELLGFLFVHDCKGQLGLLLLVALLKLDDMILQFFILFVTFFLDLLFLAFDKV